jgi:hypothetical protein
MGSNAVPSTRSFQNCNPGEQVEVLEEVVEPDASGTSRGPASNQGRGLQSQ